LDEFKQTTKSSAAFGGEYPAVISQTMWEIAVVNSNIVNPSFIQIIGSNPINMNYILFNSSGVTRKPRWDSLPQKKHILL